VLVSRLLLLQLENWKEVLISICAVCVTGIFVRVSTVIIFKYFKRRKANTLITYVILYIFATLRNLYSFILW
jgi:hypothetical protein